MSLEIGPDLYFHKDSKKSKAKGMLTKNDYNQFLHNENTLKFYLRIHLQIKFLLSNRYVIPRALSPC